MTDQPLAPKVVVLWRAASAVSFATFLLLSLVVTAWVGTVGWALVAVVTIIGLAAVVWLPPARYAVWRWRLTDQALELEHGLWRRQVRAVPYFRIQHIDLEHGPLDRWLGLAQLHVHTASVTALLPGLAATDAPRLRTRLLELAAASVAADTDDTDAV